MYLNAKANEILTKVISLRAALKPYRSTVASGTRGQLCMATLTLPEINYFKVSPARCAPLCLSPSLAGSAKLNNKLLFLCEPMKCAKFNGSQSGAHTPHSWAK